MLRSGSPPAFTLPTGFACHYQLRGFLPPETIIPADMPTDMAKHWPDNRYLEHEIEV